MRPVLPKGRKRFGGALRFPAQQDQIRTVQEILRAAVDNGLHIIGLGHGRSRGDAPLVTQRIDPSGRFEQFGVVELTRRAQDFGPGLDSRPGSGSMPGIRISSIFSTASLVSMITPSKVLALGVLHSRLCLHVLIRGIRSQIDGRPPFPLGMVFGQLNEALHFGLRFLTCGTIRL